MESIMNNDSFSLKPVLSALIGVAALASVNAQAAPAITIDEHGKAIVQGHAVSDILPASANHTPLLTADPRGGSGCVNVFCGAN
jgi:hypothetical protein